MDEKPKLPILLFDSECSLCVRFKDSLLKLNKTDHISMVPIQDESIYELFPLLDKEKCFDEIHLIKDDQTVISGQEVITFLMQLNPLVSKFSWLIESDMGKKAINYFHHMTNQYRQNIKRKCPSCMR